MKKRIENKYSILIYVVFIFLMIGVLSQKKDFHIDEYYSYGLANSPNGLAMAVDWGIKYDSDAVDRLFLNYMSMRESETFDYKTVWINQSEDVHPPLYYAVLHTVSSLFPGEFSIWFAGSINIIFAVLTLHVLRKLSDIMFKSPFMINLMSIVFVLSAEVLSVTSFFRMYIMAMFEVTLLTYYFVRLVEKSQTSWKHYLCLFILAVVNALTHYYCVVYMVFICAVYGVWLLVKKQWKKVAAFVVIMVGAAGSAIVVFPAMLEHVFSGYRGEETIENFANTSLTDYWNRLTFFFDIFDKGLLGGMLAYVLIFMAIAGFLAFVENRDKKRETQKFVENELSIVQWLIIVIPTIFYFFIIAKVTIDNGSERYMVPIYATALISFMGILYYGIRKFLDGSVEKVCLCVICAIMIINGWKVESWPYLYLNSKIDLEAESEYADVEAVAIFNGVFRVQMSYPEISKYNNVTFIPDYNSYWIGDWECAQSTELVIMLIGVDESEMSNVLAIFPNMNNYKKIGGYRYCTSYYLY